MRPLRLRLSGLRSYFDDQEIDFSKAGLIAIVGDTGAGKSSLLEAICFALYGATTWSARDVKDLISDRSDTVRVQFEFLVDGRRWQVTRSTSTGTYPPPIQELRCLDDGKLRFDGASEVTRQIEKLIGLDYTAFLRAVILPQGRFQELLQARAAERTAILKGIFRLDLLESMREVAERLHHEHGDRIHQVEMELAGMLPDPPETWKRRTEEAARARKTMQRLQETRREVEAQLERAGQEDETSKELRASSLQLEEALSGDPVGTLRELIARAEPLWEKERQLEVSSKAAQDEVSRLAARIARMDEAGLGAQGLAECEQKLAELQRGLEESARAQATIAAREADIRTLEADLARDAELLRSHEAEVGELLDQLRDARAAQKRFQPAQHLLGRLREQQEAERAAREEGERLQADWTRLTREHDEISERERSQEAALAQVRRDLEALRRKHAAAHASAECAAGDPCPVCNRELPKNFCPLQVPNEDDAREAADQAEDVLRSTSKARARVEEVLTQLATRRDQHARELAELQERNSATIADLERLLPSRDERDMERQARGSSKVMRDAEDSTEGTRDSPDSLETLVEALRPAMDPEEMEPLVESKRSAREAAHKKLTEATGKLQSIQDVQAQARENLKSAAAQCEQVWSEALTFLDAAQRTRTTDSVGERPAPPKSARKSAKRAPSDHDPSRVRPDSANLTWARSQLAAARDLFQGLASQERKVRARLDEIRKEENELRQHVEKAVTNPLLALQGKLAVLHDRIARGLRARDSDAGPSAPAKRTRSAAASGSRQNQRGNTPELRLPEPIRPAQLTHPGGLVTWAEEVESCARTLAAMLESEAARAAEFATGARRAAWEQLRAEEALEHDDGEPEPSRSPHAPHSDEPPRDTIRAANTAANTDDPLPGQLDSIVRAMLDSLNEALQEAAIAERTARKEIELARSQLPRWTTLREALEPSRPVVDALGELTRLLADGKFVGHVVQKQQRGLLAVASELLRETSGGRFGFAESFEVVDLLTGQVRNVKTLSGGETFLASLALALGLVELAGRSGGRLDALFLDEGFGSLDANCLAEALDALGRQADAGRLVAVISHLHAVAESIDDVLLVSRDAEGSHARWLGREERDALIMQDAGSGLLL